MHSSRSLLVLSAAMFLGVLVASGETAEHRAETRDSVHGCFSIIVPSYFHASAGSDWVKVISTHPQPGHGERVLILNPNSGPGEAANAGSLAIVKAAHKAGEKVYGYVPTGYGKVPLAQVEEHVRRYKRWYSVDGIFVDEVSAERAEVSRYYQPMTTFITSQIEGSAVVLNNGTYPDAEYAKIKVPASSTLQLVVFEHDYAAFTAPSFADPAWVHQYPSSMFVNIVYKTSGDEVDSVLRLSEQRNVGWVYVTDEDLPNPYSKLPSYWSAFNQQALTGCAR